MSMYTECHLIRAHYLHSDIKKLSRKVLNHFFFFYKKYYDAYKHDSARKGIEPHRNDAAAERSLTAGRAAH